MFTVNKVPGFAAQMRRESTVRSTVGHSISNIKRPDGSSSGKTRENGLRSRDNSPKMPRPRSEEIPLEDMRLRKVSLATNGSGLVLNCPERKDSTVSNSSTNGEPSSGSRRRSEETSFTSPQTQESKPRRKGQVETV